MTRTTPAKSYRKSGRKLKTLSIRLNPFDLDRLEKATVHYLDATGKLLSQSLLVSLALAALETEIVSGKTRTPWEARKA